MNYPENQSRQEQDNTGSTLGRREVLALGVRSTIALFGALVMKGSLRRLLCAGVLISQASEQHEHPTEDEVTLYRINPNPAVERPEFKQQFETAYRPAMAELNEDQAVIVAQLKRLYADWQYEYEETEVYYEDEQVCDSDNNCRTVQVQKTRKVWREPLGMDGYYTVIEHLLIHFSQLQNHRLETVSLSYPVDHTGAGHDVPISPFVPDFYEKYRDDLRKVTGQTVALFFTSLFHAVLEYKGALSFLRIENKHTGKFSGFRSMYETFLGKSHIEKPTLRDIVYGMVESYTERLKNAGVFDAFQVFLLATIVGRNSKKDWTGAFENEETFTRSFLVKNFALANNMSANDLGSALGLSSQAEIANKNAYFLAKQPARGYGSNIDFANRRAHISDLVLAFAQKLGTTVNAHNGILRDIWLADRIADFQHQRQEGLREPAEGNVRLIMAALILQFISIPFSGFHRNVVDAALDSLDL